MIDGFDEFLNLYTKNVLKALKDLDLKNDGTEILKEAFDGKQEPPKNS